jgi:hypothetical protein
VFGGPAWSLHQGRGQYYLHQFDPKQPDLNYDNPLVVEEMKVSGTSSYAHMVLMLSLQQMRVIVPRCGPSTGSVQWLLQDLIVRDDTDMDLSILPIVMASE